MKKLLTLLMLLVLTLPLAAQGRFNPQQYRQRLEEYITQKACLTPQEANKVFPIFHAMKDKQRAVMEKINNLKRSTPQTGKSDAQYRKVIDKINDLNEEQADLQEEYYERMCKAISPRKVYAVMLAEDSFHRDMLRHFSDGRGQGQQRGRGRR